MQEKLVKQFPQKVWSNGILDQVKPSVFPVIIFYGSCLK